MKRKTLDTVIKKELKNKRDSNRNNQIIRSLKKRKNSVIYDYNNARIIQKLKRDYRERQAPVINVSEIPFIYNVLVNDESVLNPFIISSGLVKIIRKHTQPYKRRDRKAQAIYDWMENNISYGKEKRKNGYKNSKEVVIDKEGVCGEMAYLYITMARCCGLKSAFVEVNVDVYGNKVNHACAIVDIGHKEILVDPAYHRFDVHHKKYTVWTDSEVLEKFNNWRLS